MNGDKRKDVIVTDPANAQVWVYLQTGHSGLSSGQTFPSLGNARTVRVLHGSDGKAEVYVLSEQEKQIGRSTFENGRLSFPSPLALEGDPVAMDVADLDGDKAPEIVYIARNVVHPRPGVDVDSFELRAATREPGGELKIEEVGAGRVGGAIRRDGVLLRRSRRLTSTRTAAATCCSSRTTERPLWC